MSEARSHSSRKLRCRLAETRPSGKQWGARPGEAMVCGCCHTDPASPSDTCLERSVFTCAQAACVEMLTAFLVIIKL